MINGLHGNHPIICVQALPAEMSTGSQISQRRCCCCCCCKRSIRWGHTDWRFLLFIYLLFIDSESQEIRQTAIILFFIFQIRFGRRKFLNVVVWMFAACFGPNTQTDRGRVSMSAAFKKCPWMQRRPGATCQGVSAARHDHTRRKEFWEFRRSGWTTRGETIPPISTFTTVQVPWGQYSPMTCSKVQRSRKWWYWSKRTSTRES